MAGETVDAAVLMSQFLLQLSETGQTIRVNLLASGGRDNRAARLDAVSAIIETATAGEVVYLDERGSYRVLAGVGGQSSKPGRVDQRPSAG